MALVRVYCGLASADLTESQPGQVVWLTVAVVDDAGRLLDICEVTDDADGYAELSALLAHRGGSSGVGVATDSDDHVVIQLLTAAGRYLAYTDEDSADDYTERFADSGSTDELQANPRQRRAIGLARALQAGVLSAVPQSPPRDMIAMKPLLAAHAAVIAGRQGAAGTLREVLRELYPAALRAYPDPAEPIPLAVLNSLPEPGMLAGGGPTARHRDERIVAELTSTGVADSATVSEAIAALRDAVVETPRRAGVTRTLTSAVAETIRQSVASVRASDAASRALISVLTDRMHRKGASARALANSVNGAKSAASGVSGANGHVTAGKPRPGGHVAAEAAGGSHAASGPPASAPRSAQRSRSGPIVVSAPPIPATPSVVSTPPVLSTPSVVSTPPVLTTPSVVSTPPVISTPPVVSGPPGTDASAVSGPPVSSAGTGLAAMFARRLAESETPAARNSSREANAGRLDSVTPLDHLGFPRGGSDPLGDRVGSHASHSGASRSEPISAAPAGSYPDSGAFREEASDLSGPYQRRAATQGRRATDAPDGGGRWQPTGGVDDLAGAESFDSGRGFDGVAAPNDAGSSFPFGGPLDSTNGQRVVDVPRQREGRVTPPWQADDLPSEPPALRLIESPLAIPSGGERSDRPYRDPLGDTRGEPPALRLVDTDRRTRSGRGGAELDRRTDRSGRGARSSPQTDLSDIPIGTDGDGDLLIFAATKSAWFVDDGGPDTGVNWAAVAVDEGWQAAEHAARPTVGDDTGAGLPRRVPQKNLVPGSVNGGERPLRIVRDAAAIAAHTTGYFQGWRRGQEVGGFAVGGRPGREAAGGWDFARSEYSDQRDYEYRSARR